jgi:hypothetical protein
MTLFYLNFISLMLARKQYILQFGKCGQWFSVGDPTMDLYNIFYLNYRRCIKLILLKYNTYTVIEAVI